jgi:hypothetical protein
MQEARLCVGDLRTPCVSGSPGGGNVENAPIERLLRYLEEARASLARQALD